MLYCLSFSWMPALTSFGWPGSAPSSSSEAVERNRACHPYSLSLGFLFVPSNDPVISMPQPRLGADLQRNRLERLWTKITFSFLLPIECFSFSSCSVITLVSSCLIHILRLVFLFSLDFHMNTVLFFHSTRPWGGHLSPHGSSTWHCASWFGPAWGRSGLAFLAHLHLLISQPLLSLIREQTTYRYPILLQPKPSCWPLRRHAPPWRDQQEAGTKLCPLRPV